jgi:anti-sigma B factor antagonist
VIAASRELAGEPRTGQGMRTDIIIISGDGALVGPRSAPPAGRTVVGLRGGLDLATAPALREQLIRVLHRGTGLLVLDLSRVASCDSSGLAVLIGTQRRAGLLGIAMRLAALSPPVREVLRSTGLDRNFEVFPDVPGALAPERHGPATLRPALTALAVAGAGRPAGSRSVG